MDEDLRVMLAKRCRDLRKRRGLSQLDMVRYHDWTLSHYQRIERGGQDPKLSTLAKLARTFGVTLSQLLRGL